MKNKFKFGKLDLHSIKFRVWLYFLILIIVCLALVWFLQIFFVSNYYSDMKISTTKKYATEISSTYKTGNWKNVMDVADAITTDNDVFIEISRGGEAIYPQSEATLYSSEIKNAKSTLEKKHAKSRTKTYSTIIKNNQKKDKTYVYATYLDEKTNTVLYLVTPVYPIKSTMDIIQNQLIYVIIVSLLLAFILAFFLSNKIVRPLGALTQSARRLADGEYGTSFPTAGTYTEIDDLSRALNVTSIELEKSTSMQKDLLANVSHDLRTPLTMIKSYAELIKDISGDNPEKREAHLQVIIDESDRLTTLVGDMMALSAMQAGNMTIHMGVFDIKEATEAVIAPYLLLEENEGYDIKFNCKENFMVEGDEEKIKQVISNLVTNAIKYCGLDKQIEIHVRRWGKKVHFDVVDHGVGIKPDELDHIWERYYKTSTHHVRSTTGSGLGLSIVNEILSLHNAKFGAESKIGKGTTFWFELNIASNKDLQDRNSRKTYKNLIDRHTHVPDKDKQQK